MSLAIRWGWCADLSRDGVVLSAWEAMCGLVLTGRRGAWEQRAAMEEYAASHASHGGPDHCDALRLWRSRKREAALPFLLQIEA
jgi:hypothetical protein